MPRQEVCLYVCLSQYGGIMSIIKFFTILVFLHQTEWQYSDGDPLTGRRMQKSMKKITIFDQYLAISLLWKANRKPHPSFRMDQFEWSWATSNPDLKVAISFNVK